MSNDELIKELFDSVADLAGFVDVALSSDKCDVFGFLHNDATDALIKAKKLLKLLKD